MKVLSHTRLQRVAINRSNLYSLYLSIEYRVYFQALRDGKVDERFAGYCIIVVTDIRYFSAGDVLCVSIDCVNDH